MIKDTTKTNEEKKLLNQKKIEFAKRVTANGWITLANNSWLHICYIVLVLLLALDAVGVKIDSIPQSEYLCKKVHQLYENTAKVCLFIQGSLTPEK